MMHHEPDYDSNWKLIYLNDLPFRPLVNILIRTSHRPEMFGRCIASVESQTYKNMRVIVSYDDPRAFEYIPKWCETVAVGYHTAQYGYNLYCNDLKARVTSGYYFFLDDDDRLCGPDAIADLVAAMDPDHHIYLVNFARGSVLKPGRNAVERGKVGMPCIVLHECFRHHPEFTDAEDADYQYIKYMTDRFRYRYIPLTLVKSPRRGFGYLEI